MNANSWKDYIKQTFKKKFKGGGDLVKNDTSYYSWGGIFKSIAATYCDNDMFENYLREDSKISFFKIFTPAKLFNPFLHLQNISGLIQISIVKGIDFFFESEDKIAGPTAQKLKKVTAAPFRGITAALGPVARIEKSPPADVVNKWLNEKIYGSEYSPAANEIKEAEKAFSVKHGLNFFSAPDKNKSSDSKGKSKAIEISEPLLHQKKSRT